MLPKLDDEAKLIHVGKMTLLRRARREAILKLRGIVVPLFNSPDREISWSTEEVRGLLNEVDAINQAIADLN